MRRNTFLLILELVILAIPTVIFLGAIFVVIGLAISTGSLWFETGRTLEVHWKTGFVFLLPVYLIIGIVSTILFFICLYLFLKERRKAKAEKETERKTILSYTT